MGWDGGGERVGAEESKYLHLSDCFLPPHSLPPHGSGLQEEGRGREEGLGFHAVDTAKSRFSYLVT